MKLLKIFRKFFKNFKKIGKFLKKLVDKEDKKAIFSFLVEVSFFGFIFNYFMHFLFHSKFNIETIIAYGFFVFFIERKFIKWIRRAWIR